MEYKKHLTKVKPTLIEITNCNTSIIVMCRAENIIGLDEEHELNAKTSMISRNYLFWNIIETRPGCYDRLVEMFTKTCQSGVVQLLKDGEKDDKKRSQSSQTKCPEVPIAFVPPAPRHSQACYKLSRKNIGLALIINIVNYDSKHGMDRFGAENDTVNMVNLWKNFGYQCITHQGKLCANELNQIIKSFLGKFNEDDRHQSCVVFLGGHGDDGGLIMSDQNRVELYEEIILKFAESPVLAGKPKLFISNTSQTFPICDRREFNYSKLKDIIVCYPNQPGGHAYRNSQSGSHYVNTICQVFSEESTRMELKDMLELVQHKLSQWKFNFNYYMEDVYMVPYYKTFSFKHFYFKS